MADDFEEWFRSDKSAISHVSVRSKLTLRKKFWCILLCRRLPEALPEDTGLGWLEDTVSSIIIVNTRYHFFVLTIVGVKKQHIQLWIDYLNTYRSPYADWCAVDPFFMELLMMKDKQVSTSYAAGELFPGNWKNVRRVSVLLLTNN